MNRIEIASSDSVDPIWSARCRRFAAKVLKRRRIKNWELSILFCDDLYMRELNQRYRAVEAATDVLSFSQAEAGENPSHYELTTAGDVVISLETMRRNAGQQRIAEEEELKRLLVHGILHLEGMDHSEEQTEMIRIQESILSQMNKEKIF